MGIKKGLRILVVDDNHDLRNAIMFLLELLDHDAVGAESAERAEILIKEYQFELIFSDIKMKGKDGLAFSKELNDSHPDMPVVLMTAYNDFGEFLEEARKLKVFDVFPIPLTEEKVLEVINRMRSKNERKSIYLQDKT